MLGRKDETFEVPSLAASGLEHLKSQFKECFFHVYGDFWLASSFSTHRNNVVFNCGFFVFNEDKGGWFGAFG